MSACIPGLGGGILHVWRRDNLRVEHDLGVQDQSSGNSWRGVGSIRDHRRHWSGVGRAVPLVLYPTSGFALHGWESVLHRVRVDVAFYGQKVLAVSMEHVQQ